MSSDYDNHVLKIIKRGVSIQKVIAAYQHSGSLGFAAKTCGIAKDTVKQVLRRNGIEQKPKVKLPSKATLGPGNVYSDFAQWHKAHAKDKDLPSNPKDIAKLANVSVDTVRCYFYRRRRKAQGLLSSLPNLSTLDLTLEDFGGEKIPSSALTSYRYAIERYSDRAVILGIAGEDDLEVAIPIPSIEIFVKRIKALT